MKLSIVHSLYAITVSILIRSISAAPNENSWEFKHMKNEHHLTMYDVCCPFNLAGFTETSRTMHSSGYTISTGPASGLLTT